MAIPIITVRPDDAARAYRSVDAGDFTTGQGGQDFGATLQNAISSTVDVSRDAEAKSVAAIAGSGDVTDMVTAVSKAELTLQTAMALRDRVVQAYQDIIKMPI
jgi:flagellar hook-basal body complex protein FliE